MKNPSYSYDPSSGGSHASTSGFVVDQNAPPQYDGFAPAGTWDKFQETLNSSSSGGTSTSSGGFQSQSDFPDWMKPDMKELEGEYGGVDQYFDLSGKIKPMRNYADAQYSQALQQGANAGQEAISRAFQSGIVGPINTSMISAQTALPGLQARLGTESDIANLKINNMYREQQARAQLAGQIAQQRQSYVNTLAQYAISQQQTNLGYQNLNLATRKQDFTEQQYGDQLHMQQQQQGPSYDELARVMTAYNGSAGYPQATNFWQQFGAGLGDFGSRPAKISFGGATNPGY